MKIFIFYAAWLATLVLRPQALWAQIGPEGEPVPLTEHGSTGDYGLENPLNADSLVEFVAQVLKLVYQVGLPVVIIMIVYAGFLYVKARGNPGEIQSAHNALRWTLIGAAIILGASVIAVAIEGTIKSLAK
jgi:hypothetical protein